MQYSVTVGTVFERSKVPLHTWLYANHLLCSSKKGISSHQLARMLGVTYKTAWFMAHRIREAMRSDGSTPIGGEGKTIEADETYIGRKGGETSYGHGGTSHKRAVLGLVERGGAGKMIHIEKATKKTVQGFLRIFADRKSNLHTDEANFYRFDHGFKSHESVNHSAGEYARWRKDGRTDAEARLDGLDDDGLVTTNTVEGMFSIFKRGMVGVYQHCGEQHLQRYLDEFDFRYSNRIKLGVNDDMRADEALKGIKGKRLTYRRLDQSEHA